MTVQGIGSRACRVTVHHTSSQSRRVWRSERQYARRRFNPHPETHGHPSRITFRRRRAGAAASDHAANTTVRRFSRGARLDADVAAAVRTRTPAPSRVLHHTKPCQAPPRERPRWQALGKSRPSAADKPYPVSARCQVVRVAHRHRSMSLRRTGRLRERAPASRLNSGAFVPRSTQGANDLGLQVR